MVFPHARTAHGSVRRLFAVYALASLVPVLALGGVLLGLIHWLATQQGLAQSRSEAKLVARTVVTPIVGTKPLSDGLDAQQRHDLQRSVGTAVTDGQILRLRLRTLAGTVVWASDSFPAGTHPDDDALAAARGQSVAHVTHLNSDDDADDDDGGKSVAEPSDVDDTNPGPRVAEAYIPITNPSNRGRLGVLEVYLPYAPIAQDVAQGQQWTTVSLTFGLVMLWLVLLGISYSVTGRLRRTASDNEFLAGHDTLTRLPNRAEFGRLVDRALRQASAERPVAVAVIDLDRFKEVNDTLGHANGDRLLVSLAARLQSLLRENDVVARLGGDEFGVVLCGVHGPSEAIEILQRLRIAVSEPLTLDGLPLAIEASVGFALAPEDGTDIGTLMTRADVAMYAAKRSHLGVAHYQPDHDTYDATALRLVAELGVAIQNDELVLHYQPKADIQAGDVTAVEALVRWQHPTRGLLYPDSFLFAAEQTELVEPLTRWVLREAVTTLGTIDPAGRLVVAVNVSARSLIRLEFADDVMTILRDTNTDPTRVILEITETALLSDPQRAAATLARLHAYGVRVSIDDFGAGQTSLGYLATLPVAELKIDKAFVLAMNRDERNAAIVHSVIELGHSLGFTVTAEGVETQEVLDDLTAAHCDLVQGYLLARPMAADQLAAALPVLRAAVASSAGA